jgi:chemotaxis response regulator CheB
MITLFNECARLAGAISDGLGRRPGSVGCEFMGDPESTGARGPHLIRVLVAEDEQPLREALCDLIASQAGMKVAGAAADAGEAIALTLQAPPDVAVLDIKRAGGGARPAAEIVSDLPDTKVVAVSAYEDRGSVLEMLRNGGLPGQGHAPREVSAQGRGVRTCKRTRLHPRRTELAIACDKRGKTRPDAAPREPIHRSTWRTPSQERDRCRDMSTGIALV